MSIPSDPPEMPQKGSFFLQFFPKVPIHPYFPGKTMDLGHFLCFLNFEEKSGKNCIFCAKRNFYIDIYVLFGQKLLKNAYFSVDKQKVLLYDIKDPNRGQSR